MGSDGEVDIALASQPRYPWFESCLSSTSLEQGGLERLNWPEKPQAYKRAGLMVKWISHSPRNRDTPGSSPVFRRPPWSKEVWSGLTGPKSLRLIKRRV